MRLSGSFGVPKFRSWSWQAFLLGFVVMTVSAGLQAACVALGASLYFAAFLPSIFVIGFIAGTPAAAFSALLAIPLVWWAFMPPFFEFNPLTSADADSIKLFFLFAVLLIGLADLCRKTPGIGGPRNGAATNSQ